MKMRFGQFPTLAPSSQSAELRTSSAATRDSLDKREGSMSKSPITRIRDSVPQTGDDKVEVIETGEGAQQGFGAFFSFHYSYTEISAFGGKARVKSRRASFEQGKLVSESFEADMSPDAYDQVVGQAQQLFENQMRLLLQPLSRFLPFSGRRGR